MGSTPQSSDRLCVKCSKPFRGHTLCCPACRRVKRACTGCGREFSGITLKCDWCRATERVCRECGETFTGLSSKCHLCKQQSWWESLPEEARDARKARARAWRMSLPAETRRAQQAAARGVRRARKAAQTDVCGPVPQKVYEAIRASGPCVYCGQPATTVDHVRPLVQGGWEHESNLVPACQFCNFSKGPRLLTKWRLPERVAYGVAHSPKVAAEFERLMEEVALTSLGRIAPRPQVAEEMRARPVPGLNLIYGRHRHPLAWPVTFPVIARLAARAWAQQVKAKVHGARSYLVKAAYMQTGQLSLTCGQMEPPDFLLAVTAPPGGPDPALFLRAAGDAQHDAVLPASRIRLPPPAHIRHRIELIMTPSFFDLH